MLFESFIGNYSYFCRRIGYASSGHIELKKHCAFLPVKT